MNAVAENGLKPLCRGCQTVIAEASVYDHSDVVHDKGCMFYVPESSIASLDLGVEYLTDSPPSLAPQDEHVTEWLNDKAADGWRLITVDRGTYYFQRPAQKLRLAREHQQ